MNLSYFDALLNNRILLPKYEFYQVAQENGLLIDGAEYQVFIVAVASCDDLFERYSRFVRLQGICAQYVRKNSKYYRMTSDGAERCMLIHSECDLAEPKKGDPASEILAYMIKHNVKDVVIVGGQKVNDIMQISSSYERAYHTLYYVGTCNAGQIYYSDDYENLFGLPVLQSTIDLDHILQVFRSGTKHELRELVIASAERVRSMSGYHTEKHRPTSIRRMFIELTVYILHIAADMSIDVDELLGSMDPYRFLMTFPGGTAEMVEWFVGFCETIRNAIDEKKQSKEEILFDEIITYINEHITDYNLSLTVISERMGISVSYLSRLFRKKMNAGFSKFVAKRRLELVCENLIQTEDDLETIAEKTGYSSATYLGKKFKSAFGCTPNCFRRSHKMNNG